MSTINAESLNNLANETRLKIIAMIKGEVEKTEGQKIETDVLFFTNDGDDNCNKCVVTSVYLDSDGNVRFEYATTPVLDADVEPEVWNEEAESFSMDELYEVAMQLIAEEKHDCPNFERVPIVSIAEQDGEKGVRLCVGDIDIFIEAHDLDEDGKEFEWDEAMKKLKAYGKRTFYKHEMYLIAAFKDEINAALREIGGAEIDNFYWSSTEYSRGSAWIVNFSSGPIGNNHYAYGKYGTYVVRPVAAFKHK